MALQKSEYIWMNGEYIGWDDAKIHVLSHVVHYGSSWFEGVRAYETTRGTAVFRLQEHMARLTQSLKIYRSEMDYTPEQLSDVALELIRRNKLKSCYIRPVAFRGYGELGVYPMNCPMEVVIAAWPWGRYLGPEAVEEGVDVCVSSWNRIAPNTMPTLSKAGGNYMNAQLIKIEARSNGFTEGIGLSVQGYVSEGSGENIFLVQDGVLYTTPLGASILAGITRSSIIEIAGDLNIQVVTDQIPRAMLYTADEIFFTGTAVEVTPVRSVDHVVIGDGKPGPVTRRIQNRFFSIVESGDDPYGWLTFVNE